MSWAGGEGGIFNPFAQHRGDELKRQLVRASHRRRSRRCAMSTRRCASGRSTRSSMWCRAAPATEDVRNAGGATETIQFEAWDMLLGRAQPELGVREDAERRRSASTTTSTTSSSGSGRLIVPSRPALPPRQRHAAARSTRATGGRSTWPRPASRTRRVRPGCATRARAVFAAITARRAGRRRLPLSRSSTIPDGRTTATAPTAWSTTPTTRDRVRSTRRSPGPCPAERQRLRLDRRRRRRRRARGSAVVRARLGGARHAGAHRGATPRCAVRAGEKGGTGGTGRSRPGAYAGRPRPSAGTS